MHARVISMRDEVAFGETEVNTTSRTKVEWQRGLSPFFLGPCRLYGPHVAKNMENAWQFSKVYTTHVDIHGDPTHIYWDWAKKGWASDWAHRYPMGHAQRPLYSFWDGERLDYIEARKKIYVPLYAEAVLQTPAWAELQRRFRDGEKLALRDFDGYDNVPKGMSLTDVLNCSSRKMGHAFVLLALLLEDEMLQECEMR
jgi:hypothetical protein